MTTVNTGIDQKIDNVQYQLDVMHREDAAFKGYVNRQFAGIANEMVTKEDLRRTEANIVAEMACKKDLRIMEARMKTEMTSSEDLRCIEIKLTENMATKVDLGKLTTLVMKIAEKMGVST
jgi:hypothetical protein